MRIYRIVSEHKKWGQNYDAYKVAARSCEEAIRKSKKQFVSGERVESVELLAKAD